MLEFDLASIPADAVVDQATLTLFCRKLSTSSATLYLYRVTKGWGESSVTWNSQPATGSQSEGTLYLSSSSYQAKEVDLTALVQGWVEGSQVNQGVMVKEGGSTAYGQCYSSDYGTAAQRPKLEVHWHQDPQPTTRSYYYLGSQRIAMQLDDGGESEVRVAYFHTDHLGSTSAMSNESGVLVEGSVTRYLPYGGYRTAPGANLTDHGFTGHKHNDEVGLIYMRARFYLPGLGRVASADTLVPDPGDPQLFNRYSYVAGNPLKYRDPTGHALACGLSGEACEGEPPPEPTMELLEDTAAQLLERLGEDPPSFDLLYEARDWLMEKGVDAVGFRFNGSGGYKIGVTGSFDVIYNFNSEEIDAFFSLGPQGYDLGASGSAGIVLVWNLPDNGGYSGWSLGPTAGIVNGLAGIDVSLEISLQEYKGELPVSLYIGYGLGEEVTAGIAVQKTWTLEEVLGFLGITP